MRLDCESCQYGLTELTSFTGSPVSNCTPAIGIATVSYFYLANPLS